MDFKQIKNKKHYLYDSIEEFSIDNDSIPVRHNWRHGEEGEWVFTDDGFVCEILKKTKIKNSSNRLVSCVRTVCGTFLTKDLKKEMLGENGIAENIYTFSGNNLSKEEFNKRKRNSRELLFAKYVACGIDISASYKMAYPSARESKYIKDRTEKLLKTETISKMVKQEILTLLAEYEATPQFIIEKYKIIADLAERDSDKLNALRDLAKMAGLFNTEDKKSEQITVWAGWSPEQLEGVKKHGEPELIAHAEKDEND